MKGNKKGHKVRKIAARQKEIIKEERFKKQIKIY